MEEPDQTLYRRSDPETLHSRLVLGEFGLVPTYLWCTGGEGGSRWLLAELRGVDDAEDGTEWFTNIGEASEAGFRRKAVKGNGVVIHQELLQPEPVKEEEGDEDAYWAAYDQTPAQTPQMKRSPAPQTSSRTQIGPTQSELDYFARYAQEVQPALDAHDPDEESISPSESTLNGNTLNYTRKPQFEPLETSNLGPNGYDSSIPLSYTSDNTNGKEVREEDKAEYSESIEKDGYAVLSHPRPSSSASSNSIEKLEREARSTSQSELAIKQHISTDIKSLFRLAKASGIDREEFERIIRRELDVLPLLEQDQ